MASWISDQSRIISFDILESRKSQVLVYVYVYTFKYLKIVSKVCWSFLFYSRVVLLCGLINNRLMPPGGHKKNNKTHILSQLFFGVLGQREELVHMYVDDNPHIFFRKDYQSLYRNPTQALVDYYQLFLKMCYPDHNNFKLSLQIDEEDFWIDVSST